MTKSLDFGRAWVTGIAIFAAITTLACGSPATESDPSSTRPPDIILFLADDQAQWAAGPYGNDEVETPTLDSLAAAGVLMANATSPSPVCSPARTSLLTGRMPSQHGVHDFLSERPEFDRDWLAGEVLLPELLQQAGYRTALIGKWHCTAKSAEPQRGFDRWLSYDVDPAGWRNQYLHQGTVYLSDQGSPVSVDGFQLEYLGRAAREFIASGDPEQPFFLLFTPTDTHAPFTGHPEELVEKYRNANLSFVPAGETSIFPAANAESVAPEDLGETLAQYYAAVSHQDAELAAFLDQLEARGGSDNTLVIYTSDHGLMVGQHGLLGKSNATLPQNLYEESIRVPMILRWPVGLPRAGITLDLPFDHLDLFQTILDAAGIDLPEDLRRQINSPGQSLLPKLRDPETPWRRYRFSEHGNARQISDGRHKLVRRYPPLDPRFGDELYDLEDDPHENVNLVGAADYQEVFAELSAALDRHFERFEVPEHSGRTVIDQPACNAGEPWRRIAGTTGPE
ncbi:MAG: sulfatase [Thermoanaerobaculales bacterium]